MEIIGTDNNLEKFLRSVTNSRVDVAVAFATKTEKVIDALIANGNEVFLTVGTINCFSDPVFFSYCQELAQENPRLNLAVDFRYENSIHWKVYLVSPNIVVIGSANLTKNGLSMIRDTAVRIEDENLYKKYLKIFSNLRRNVNVVASNDTEFDEFLDEYERHHHIRPQTPSFQNKEVPSFATWLTRDESQFLPLLLWERDFNVEELNEFKNEVVPKLPSNDGEISYSPISVLYSKPPAYYEGKTILFMSTTGTSAQFKFIYLVQPYNKKWWLCGVKRRRTQNTVVPAWIAGT